MKQCLVLFLSFSVQLEIIYGNNIFNTHGVDGNADVLSIWPHCPTDDRHFFSSLPHR